MKEMEQDHNKLKVKMEVLMSMDYPKPNYFIRPNYFIWFVWAFVGYLYNSIFRPIRTI